MRPTRQKLPSAAGRLATFRPTLDLLADRWREAGPLLPGFSLLARGRPVSVGEIARAAGAGVDRVETAIEAARCERDADGRVLELYGLALKPTSQRLDIAGKTLFACCALWAHVIPKLVGATVRVESVDPMRQRVVRLTLSPAGIESADPPGSAATLAVATRQAITTDVGQAFCSHVRHHPSLASAEEFAAAEPARHAVGLAELQEAADYLYAAIWRAAGG